MNPFIFRKSHEGRWWPVHKLNNSLLIPFFHLLIGSINFIYFFCHDSQDFDVWATTEKCYQEKHWLLWSIFVSQWFSSLFMFNRTSCRDMFWQLCHASIPAAQNIWTVTLLQTWMDIKSMNCSHTKTHRVECCWVFEGGGKIISQMHKTRN